MSHVTKLVPWGDEWGPEHIIKVYDRETGMEGVLVIDNTTLGPGKGGIRMTANVTDEEVFRLARTMTWKNALAGIPFGGAKAGIRFPENPKDKKAHIQAFAKRIGFLTPKKYIAGPDVNTGEQEMQWFVEETGNWRSATGKPANYCMAVFGEKNEKCGIPHEFGSTGFGVAQATKVIVELLKMNMNGRTVAIHGFGNVGMFAIKYLSEMGAKIVAVGDKSGGIYNEKGLDPKKLFSMAESRKEAKEYKDAEKISAEKVLELPVDILIPASVTDIIHEGNKKNIKAKIIVEGGNIPMQESIEEELWKRGIIIVPDFVANAGGVISSYAEYRGYNPKRMFELVEKRITDSTRSVMKKALASKENPREIALEIAKAKVNARMRK